MTQELKPAASVATTPEALRALISEVLAEALKQGASAAEASASVSQGLSVTVRLGNVETVEHTRDKGLGITVYFGKQSGSASTSDLGPEAIHGTVRAAASIAKYTAADEFSGLADVASLAKSIPDLDLYHPWNPGADRAIEIAAACEHAARSADARILNSEGASLSSHEGLEVYGNTNGFLGAVAATRHALSCAVVAQDDSGMQRDYWYTVARDARDLEVLESVGRQAAARAVRRLAARKLSTRETPVLYEAPVASSLLSHFVGAVRGTSLYREASFLLGQLGKPVFAPWIRIYEQPHLRKGLGSAPFDNEGVATRDRDLVRDGMLLGYVLDSYSARKLGMETTGNAGGVHNLAIEAGDDDFPALLARMHTGLLVTELIGFGVNTVTGDYSRGAAGFWVENGEIQFPVEEITIAGNLREMFRQIVAVGRDVDLRGNIRTGSILVENMTLAGS
ncbi:MAG: metalloprotease PmbA [Acidiferrobacterales bacterium]